MFYQHIIKEVNREQLLLILLSALCLCILETLLHEEDVEVNVFAQKTKSTIISCITIINDGTIMTFSNG